MSKKLTPIAAALGTAFALSIATSPVAADAANPFAQADLVSGYSVAMGDGPDKAKKETEGKCGAEKAKSAAEGKCGAEKAKSAPEGKCGAEKSKSAAESKCGAKK